VEPENLRQAKLARRRRRKPRYAVRKPKGYRIEAPGDLALVTAELNRQLEEWEHTYNHIRPHETLDYLTPNEYYRRWKKTQKSQASLML